LSIGDRTFPIRQAAGGNEPGIPQPPGPVPPPAQPGCTFTLSPTSLSLLAPGTTSGAIRVSTQPECRWAITVSVPWIQLSGAATRQGDSVVNFSAPANSESNVRAGVITAGNVTFAVVQTTLAPGNRPRLQGIVNGASFSNALSANSFASVVGSALSAGTANWDNEVRDGVFPKELIATRVRVNGLDTYPVYVSPTQINFLTPPNPFPGVDSRPAKPGDIMTLYATGLGPTSPGPPLGRALTAPLAVTDLGEYRVEIGGMMIAQLDYVGMIYARVISDQHDDSARHWNG